MKKLMMLVAIVCATIAANAATVSWKSGTTIKPDGSAAAASGTLNMFVWTVAEGTYNDLAMDKIWDNYGSDKIADMTASATAYKTGFGSATGGTANIAGVDNSTTLYGVIITAWDSDKDGTVDMYAVNKAIGSVNDSGTATSPNYLAKFEYGVNGGTAVSWQTAAVPEPTSGLLLLLGMAGLALKRKRA